METVVKSSPKTTLNGLNYSLRWYQKEASDKAVEMFESKSKKSGLVIIPSAGGKSHIIADIVKRLNGNVLIFSPTKEILMQNMSKLMHVDPFIDCRAFSASVGRKEIGKITYGTIGSVVNKKELFRNVDYVIVDEADVFNPIGGQYKQFMDFIGNKKILGVTASAFRAATNSFGTEFRFLTRTKKKAYNELLYHVQIPKLVEEGYWAKTKYYDVSRGFDESKMDVNSTRLDYTDQSIINYYDEIGFEQKVADMVDRLQKAGRKHILVFTKFVKEAELVQKKLGNKCRVVSGETDKDERAETLKWFENTDDNVVTNCQALGVGYDFPELDCVLFARPLRSLRLWMQMTARAVRPHKNKEEAWIVDMCGAYRRFGKLEDITIRTQGNNKWFYESNGKQLTNVYLD